MGLFEEQVTRKPNRYPWTSKFTKAMHDSHWTVHKFTFSSDIQDFKVVLSNMERDIITKTLSAIGQIEIEVKTFWAKLGDNLKHPSIRDLGYVMANVEVIHNDAYEMLLSKLNLEHVFEENLQNPIIKGRVQYLKKYLNRAYEDDRKQYIYAIILFTLFIENVSLFSQFYIINWFGRYQNVLKDTNMQTNYTRSEETLHFMAGAKIINTLREEYPELFDKELETRILQEAQVAFECEQKVIDWIIGDYKGDRLNKDIIKEYIKYKLNEGLAAIGVPELYVVADEDYKQFDWMIEETLAKKKVDWFYTEPTEYTKADKPITSEELF